MIARAQTEKLIAPAPLRRGEPFAPQLGIVAVKYDIFLGHLTVGGTPVMSEISLPHVSILNGRRA